jgi:hypothetical protein
LPPEVQEHIKRKLLDIQKIPDAHKGRTKHIDKLKGYSNLYEVRTPYRGTAYRPLGCGGPGLNQLVLLTGAKKHQKNRRTRWIPNSALRTCKRLESELLAGKGDTVDPDLD